MTALFEVTDRSLLIDLLNGGGSFLPPEAILDGLT